MNTEKEALGRHDADPALFLPISQLCLQEHGFYGKILMMSYYTLDLAWKRHCLTYSPGKRGESNEGL